MAKLDSTSVYGNLTVTRDVYAKGNITAYSDRRLKENIEPIYNALDKVNSLNGCTFNKKETPTSKPNLRRSTGVIAQEVQSVLPEAVLTDQDGFLSVDYGSMVGLLIESNKELSAKVDYLQNKVNKPWWKQLFS